MGLTDGKVNSDATHDEKNKIWNHFGILIDLDKTFESDETVV